MLKKLKNLISVFLVSTVVMASLTGCIGKATPSTDSSEVSVETNAKESVKEIPELNKDAKLTVAVSENTTVKTFGENGNENKNMFIDALKEKTGYKNLEFTIIPGTNQMDTFNLMFASGDVYDLILNADLSLFQRYSAQGNLLALNEIIDNFGNDIKPYVNKDTWQATSVNGKIYALASPSYQQYNGQFLTVGNIVRLDWMEKLGLKAPKNLDEYYNFLKEMKDKDPSGKGTIPLVSWGGQSGNPLDGLEPVTTAFGLAGLENLPVQFIVKDDKLVDAQDVYLKDCIEYLANLYKDGLLDKESLFNKSEQTVEKFASSKASMMAGAYYQIKGLSESLSTIDPNAKLGFLPEIEGPDGMKGPYRAAPISRYIMIPSKAKNPNEAVDFINTYMKDEALKEFINFGTEGVHYTKEGNDLKPIQPAYDEILYKIYYRLWYNPEIWGINAKLAGYEPGINAYTSVDQHMIRVNLNYYRPQTEEELSYGKTLLDLRNEYAAKIISGALPISAFDEYIKKADGAGRQKIIAASQEWFNTTGKAIYEQLK